MKPLQEYEKKRDFKKTLEPQAKVGAKKNLKKNSDLIFVVQEHHASHLHYDFRLEWDGVLKSWAVPKGPSLDPSVKRLAVEVEDHPVSYARFKGSIPDHEYGGGEVYIWDSGTWNPKNDVKEGLKKGRLEFSIRGRRLKGDWILIRTRRASGGKNQWLLMKRTDSYAQAGDEAEVVGKDLKTLKMKKAKSGKAASALKIRSKTKSSVKSRRAETPSVQLIKPELALLVDSPPEGPDWIHETKYDGYRTQAHVHPKSVQLLTRAGKDWTAKYPSVAKGLSSLKVSCILDGEIVSVDDKGHSDFQKLQNDLKSKDTSSIHYFIFDLLFLDGEDLRSLPLMERKKKLKKLLQPLQKAQTAIHFSDHLEGVGSDVLESACGLNLEGIVSKQVSSPYVSGRTDSWLKSKCQMRQEFVIGGYTKGTGTRVGFGALLLGVYEDKKLRYVGKVGTGFTQDSLKDLKKTISRLEQNATPFVVNSPKEKGLHFIKPTLVAEISFSNWTRDGILRVPVFHGLREDKAPISIQREIPVSSSRAKHLKSEKPKTEKKSSSTSQITHPDKIIFAKEEITKQDVFDYYIAVSKLMIPHMSERPLSLLRCPQGSEGTCFFQKHVASELPSSVHSVSIREKTATRDYMTIDSSKGLASLVQQGTLEFHAWGSRSLELEKPDQIVMDFDPDPSVDWLEVKEGVLEFKDILDQLDLVSFLKVTGGKGLHVHIPIEPLYDWEQVKNFSLTLARELVSRKPKSFTTVVSKKSRSEKVYLDYLRNSRGSTSVVPYSLRAKKISSVALPLDWKELEKLKSANQWTLEATLERLKKQKQDPWKDFFKSAQKLTLLEDV